MPSLRGDPCCVFSGLMLEYSAVIHAMYKSKGLLSLFLCSIQCK